jgi:hypothetical protein
MEFKFRKAGTNKYFKVKNGSNCIFDIHHGIDYICPGLKEIIILPGFKVIDHETYVEIVRD